MAIPTLEPTEHSVDLPPFRGDCVRCWVEVLVVVVAGADVVVEVDEVLEAFRCPVCSQVEAKQHERGRCLRCGNTGVVGERLPPFAIALAEDGRARYYVGGRPAEGEGIYVEHLCGT